MKKKKTGGRPRQILSKQEKALILALFREGKTDLEVAKVLGLQRKCFRDVLAYNKLKFTIAGAKKIADEEVVRSLYERACGYSHPAVKISFDKFGDALREEYTGHYPPDTAAATLWLCNRQPDKWKNTNRTELTGIGNKPLEIKVIFDEKGKTDSGKDGSSPTKTTPQTE